MLPNSWNWKGKSKMKTSEKIDVISKALLQAQKEIGAAVKGSKNPFYNSNYADFTEVIKAIKEPLNNSGISFLQLVHSNEVDMVETILLHESGQFISTETRVYCGKPNDPQAFGTGITYAKRYALQAALGLPTEDDDGNAAAQKPKAEPIPEPDAEVMDKLQIILEENTDGQPISMDKLKTLLWTRLKKYPATEEEAKKTANWLIEKQMLNALMESN